MSNYHGQGVPYGIPRFPPPPSGGTSSPDEYGGPRQNMNRQGPTSQQQRTPQNNPGVLRKNGPNNFSRGPMRPPQGQQQWPLGGQDGSPAPSQNAYPRAMPPQRPPRPTGTAVLGQPKPASNRNEYDNHPIPQYANAPPTASSVYSGPGVWSDNGYDSPSSYPSPNSTRPITGASMASTSSSYSVPDAPPPLPSALPPLPANHQQIRQQQQQQQQQQMQQMQMQQQQAYPPKSPRERAPLGPPPSSRRGPSSYYSQPTHLSQVTPIVEESDRDSSLRGSSLRPGDDSRGSYASSNAIPIGVPDYYLNDSGTPRFGRPNADSYASEYDEPEIMQPPRVALPRERDSPPALVRQASLGKRSKPTLTTIKSGENMRNAPGRESTYSDDSFDEDGMQSLPPMQRPPLEPVDSSNTLNKSQMSDQSKGAQSGRTGSSGPLGMSETSFFDRPSSSESDKSEFARYKNKEYLYEPMPDRIPRQPTNNSEDPRVESILNRLEKGGALPHVDDKTSHLNQPSQLSQRVGTRRPPRLNVDAVREAEQRGSLTSLPDLIRRATKLASNLDRGKTASRLGFDWMISDEKGTRGNQNRRSNGSLTDMISAFPPPAVGTPRSQGSGRFAWPSNLRHSTLPSFSDNGKGQSQPRPKKRVCGMPVWAFLLLLLLLILLVAAAVIVPVVLIVIPRQNQSDAQSLDSCRQSLTCSNGGVNIVGNDGACRCVCVNGFTGSSCTTEVGASCTGLDVQGASNATVGSSLPRLFNNARANFSIPLDGAQVLSLFAATNLSCASENALVTFGGLSERRSINLDKEYFDTAADIAEIYLGEEEDFKPTKTLKQRQVTTTVASSQAAATSNGIVFAIGGPPGSSPSNSPNNTSPLELDFARVAVLFVLQDSGQLNEAIAAQSSLQKWFSGGSAPGIASTNITLQNGYSANLNTGQIVVKNGTKVGSA
ncbi:hypothetical protein BDZ85DRAFT_32917 [Elsinoe ampelina]|uniref:EGF-like domain-containing protein n=1 Tax=Elsinoe ampelina TaxID=302913 RepID=A0A6A6G424_9PEZI|nr:hypothetical protein BDZ85DRAFT_32917 [Elsinoe ampelina]